MPLNLYVLFFPALSLPMCLAGQQKSAVFWSRIACGMVFLLCLLRSIEGEGGALAGTAVAQATIDQCSATFALQCSVNYRTGYRSPEFEYSTGP